MFALKFICEGYLFSTFSRKGVKSFLRCIFCSSYGSVSHGVIRMILEENHRFVNQRGTHDYYYFMYFIYLQIQSYISTAYRREREGVIFSEQDCHWAMMKEQVNVLISTHIVHLYLLFTGRSNLRIGHIICLFLNINGNMANQTSVTTLLSFNTFH